MRDRNIKKPYSGRREETFKVHRATVINQPNQEATTQEQSIIDLSEPLINTQRTINRNDIHKSLISNSCSVKSARR